MNLAFLSPTLLVVICLSNSAISPVTSAECPKIVKCADIQLQTITEDQQKPDDLIIPSEKQIGDDRHWMGIKPERYDLKLSFSNYTHYSGSVTIDIKTVRATKRLMLNNHVHYPKYDFTTVEIAANCSGASRPNLPANICIKKITMLDYERTLVLDLSAELPNDAAFVLKVPSFTGMAYVEYPEDGALGLRKSGEDDFQALNTIFQMRYARSVFPCFDQPALKARFDFCIEYPEEFTTASNMPPIGTAPARLDGARLRQCFHTTPVIPTYLFTFTLMKGYVELTDDNVPLLRLLVPASRKDRLKWMLPNGSPVVEYFTRITGFRFPWPKLHFLVVYPAPFWGIENFGMISADGGHMETQSGTAWTILYHEIVHQWAGNAVTVSNWHEICLQESLTAYFEWMLQDKLRNHSLARKAGHASARFQGWQYPGYTLIDYQYTQDIADHCFDRPPLFYHMVADALGDQVIERLLAKLIEKNRMGNADLDMYDSTLAEVSGKPEQMTGYMKHWFGQPGPSVLAISANGSHLTIKQNLTERVTQVRPVVLKLYTSQSTTPEVLHLNKESHSFPIAQSSFFVVDPDLMTLVMKIYTADLYIKLFSLTPADDQKGVFTEERKKNVLDAFCKQIHADMLPLPGDKNADKWKTVLEKAVQSNASCVCCLKPYNQRPDSCRYKFLNCDNLEVVKLVGYNNPNATDY